MVSAEDIQIRDPFIFVGKNTYYLIGTTGTDCWNAGSDLTLYKSCDLENWERVRKLVAEDTLASYTQIWAPELHYYGGKYYIIVSVFRKEKGRGSIILVSDTVDGEYLPLTGEYITPENWWCLDATLFCHENKPYLYFSNEWVNTAYKDGDGSLYVAELSPDLKKLVTPPKRIISAKHCGFSVEIEEKGSRGYVAEAPYVLYEDGRIALYFSTFTEEGYCVVRSVADSVFGDYRFDKFVFKKDGGHAMLFTDLQGQRRITFHQPNKTPRERMKIFSV